MQASSSQEENQVQAKQSRHPPKLQLGPVFWLKHRWRQWGNGSLFRGRRKTETGHATGGDLADFIDLGTDIDGSVELDASDDIHLMELD
jgi:hypothetical protein